MAEKTSLVSCIRDEKSLTDKNDLMFSNITESVEFYITQMLTVKGVIVYGNLTSVTRKIVD